MAVVIAVVGIPVPGLSAHADGMTTMGVTDLPPAGSARGHRVHLRIRHLRWRCGRDLDLLDVLRSSDAARGRDHSQQQ